MASSNVVSIRRTTMGHEGGTKFYELLVLGGDSGLSVLIKRWGRVANIHGGGEMQFVKHQSDRAGGNDCDDMIRKKTNRGYSVDYEDTSLYTPSAALRILTSVGIEPSSAQYLLHYVGVGDDVRLDEVEIVFENPASKPPVDRSGDKEWASW